MGSRKLAGKALWTLIAFRRRGTLVKCAGNMLAVLLEVPQTPEAWNRFAFHNQDQISLIQQAILAKYKVALPEYILFPINLDSPDIWLFNNQQAHSNINTVLGLNSNNLQDLNFENNDQVTSWINQNYLELYDASQMLGV